MIQKIVANWIQDHYPIKIRSGVDDDIMLAGRGVLICLSLDFIRIGNNNVMVGDDEKFHLEPEVGDVYYNDPELYSKLGNILDRAIHWTT